MDHRGNRLLGPLRWWISPNAGSSHPRGQRPPLCRRPLWRPCTCHAPPHLPRCPGPPACLRTRTCEPGGEVSRRRFLLLQMTRTQKPSSRCALTRAARPPPPRMQPTRPPHMSGASAPRWQDSPARRVCLCTWDGHRQGLRGLVPTVSSRLIMCARPLCPRGLSTWIGAHARSRRPQECTAPRAEGSRSCSRGAGRTGGWPQCWQRPRGEGKRCFGDVTVPRVAWAVAPLPVLVAKVRCTSPERAANGE